MRSGRCWSQGACAVVRRAQSPAFVNSRVVVGTRLGFVSRQCQCSREIRVPCLAPSAALCDLIQKLISRQIDVSRYLFLLHILVVLI